VRDLEKNAVPLKSLCCAQLLGLH